MAPSRNEKYRRKGKRREENQARRERKNIFSNLVAAKSKIGTVEWLQLTLVGDAVGSLVGDPVGSFVGLPVGSFEK